MYSDARDRIRDGLGDFSYFYSFMSQPKFQLDTFRSCNLIFSLFFFNPSIIKFF